MLATRIFTAFLALSAPAYGQSDDLQQRIKGFQSELATTYSVKTLNLQGESLGALEKEEPAFQTHFKLEAKEKSEDNLGRSTKLNVHVRIFEFDAMDDLNWAMKRWMPDFIDHNVVRPGRDSKTLPHADPSIVIVEGTVITVLTLPCSQFDLDRFRTWRKHLLTYFGGASSVVIEVQGCEGPLLWTKNAPDPKDRTWK
ncbi:MAG: hypothetical protein FJX93_04830 [Bacteroidetes bacterium]|nr:hypothetical protein [Bacteroidota bacterium]